MNDLFFDVEDLIIESNFEKGESILTPFASTSDVEYPILLLEGLEISEEFKALNLKNEGSVTVAIKVEGKFCVVGRTELEQRELLNLMYSGKETLYFIENEETPVQKVDGEFLERWLLC